MVKLKKLLIFLKNNSLKKKKIIFSYSYKIYKILQSLNLILNLYEIYYINNFIIILFNSKIKKLEFFTQNINIIKNNFYKFFFIKKQIYLISTIKGLMSSLEAYKLKLKGNLICILFF
uniref:Ribosomal protein S8 n=1 Tax=Neospora caninum TaxID=29176 RepID=A0A4Y5UM61_NEOCA|nr:ribosomal protein S8 [Neospora caninum]